MPPKQHRRNRQQDDDDHEEDGASNNNNVLFLRIDRIIAGVDKKGSADTIRGLLSQSAAIGMDGRPRGKRSDVEFVNARDSQGETLLNVAAYFFARPDTTKKGRDTALAICEALLDLGAEPQLLWESRGGLSPLARACSMPAGVKDTRLVAVLLNGMEELLEHEQSSSDDDDDDDDEDSAVGSKQKQTTKRPPPPKKKKGNAEQNVHHHAALVLPPPVDQPCCAAGLPPALLCAQSGNLDSLTFLLEQRRANPEVTGAIAGQSLLHMAALGGDVACVELAVDVLGLGAQPQQQKQRGQQKRNAAAAATSVDSHRCFRGATALHYAAEQRDPARCVPVINLLVDEHGCDVNARTLRGATPALLATEANSSAALGALLRKGADPQLGATDNTKPVHVATRFGYLKAMQALMEHGVEIPTLQGPPKKPKPPKAAPKPKGKGKKAGKKAGKKSAKAKRSKKKKKDDSSSSDTSSSSDDSSSDDSSDSVRLVVKHQSRQKKQQLNKNQQQQQQQQQDQRDTSSLDVNEDRAARREKRDVARSKKFAAKKASAGKKKAPLKKKSAAAARGKKAPAKKRKKKKGSDSDSFDSSDYSDSETSDESDDDGSSADGDSSSSSSSEYIGSSGRPVKLSDADKRALGTR